MNRSNNLLRVAGTSLHKQLFMVLRDQISRGVLPPSSLMPTEESLCEQFEVSRVTVRRALADLAALGLVQRQHGRGTFVCQQPPLGLPTMSLSMMESLRQVARETKVSVVRVAIEKPPTLVAAALQLPPDGCAVHALRLRGSGSTPLLVTDAWVPERIGKKVTEAALKRKPLYRILLDQGVQFGRVIQEFSAEAADPQRASLLRVAVSAPLIRLVRLLHDIQNRPVQYLTVYACPERSRVLMEISGDQINTLSAGHMVHAPKFLKE